MMEIIPTGNGTFAGIAPLRPDAAFCKVAFNGHLVCVTTSELYQEAAEVLLQKPPEHGTPYLFDYTGPEFVALFNKALFERLDALHHQGASPDEIIAVVNSARVVLMALRNDETSRAFWPQISALLEKLGVPT